MIRVSQALTDELEVAALRAALTRGYYGHAEKVVAFEEALADYLGVEASRVVCVNTGTAGLHLALDALGVGPGDEVIVPSLTFVASFQAVSATGARPVPCEVRPENLLLDMNDVERRLTPRTKALMPVHYAGNPGNLRNLMEFGEKHGLHVVEDAAHAFGSLYQGRKVGSLGEVAVFSFDSIKNITCGEGGAIVWRDQGMAGLCRQTRLLGINRENPHVAGHQRTKVFNVARQGYRYHMSNLNAAIGLVQLSKAEGFMARRREICRRYEAAFADLEGICRLSMDYDAVAPHIYVIRVLDGRRDALIDFLKAKDIETAINYIPNHLHDLYRSQEPLPVTEKLYGEILTLPLHCVLSDAEVDFIIGSVKEFFRSNR